MKTTIIPTVGERAINSATRVAKKNTPPAARNPNNRFLNNFMILPENNELNRLAFELPSSRILEECSLRR